MGTDGTITDFPRGWRNLSQFRARGCPTLFAPYPHSSQPAVGGETGVQSLTLLKSQPGKARSNRYELEKPTASWGTHGSGHVAGNVSAAQRRRAAGCVAGAVSHDGGSVGDFRAAFCETEIAWLGWWSPPLGGPSALSTLPVNVACPLCLSRMAAGVNRGSITHRRSHRTAPLPGCPIRTCTAVTGRNGSAMPR